MDPDPGDQNSEAIFEKNYEYIKLTAISKIYTLFGTVSGTISVYYRCLICR
jgi:hypothetical protein